MVLAPLPPEIHLETTKILKKLIEARSNLAQLKGISQAIPNQKVLVNTLSLQEAKDSSEIENIITTYDEMFAGEDTNACETFTPAAKEVRHYSEALQTGYTALRQRGFISRNDVLSIQETLEQNQAGFRKLPGTALVNDRTKEVVYSPPDPQYIDNLMDNFLFIFNDASHWEIDPLIKMAALHYQFESIHPFYDGNGRTGRILNVLYLVKEGLLDFPVLYLSRFINVNKSTYYTLLQAVRDENTWEDWILFILEGIARMALTSCRMIEQIRDAMNSYKQQIRTKYPKFYSQDLINNLFFFPYTKISFLEKDLGTSYQTARKYLELLTNDGLLEKKTIWRTSYYINKSLMEILYNAEREELRL
jgi:Fic family protein